MDIKRLSNNVKNTISKYKYATIILLIGICLLLVPAKTKKSVVTDKLPQSKLQAIESEQLAQILQSVKGAGKVKVLLSVATGEKTLYQTDSDVTGGGDNNSSRLETVIVMDAQRAETGLINQINPPTYLGAIVVCEGADSATVKFAVTQAVAKITGLGTDSICVLKMES